ncbi:MAG: hypothetical protein KBG14_00725 [Bacteroidales bacterium]|nr:hypothetical protein [Bacteroidales bacterium]
MTTIVKIEIGIQIVGLLVSIGTLFIAWLIMNNFQKQELSLKQLEKVIELIEYINNHRIGFLFGRTGSNMYTGDFIEMTLFEIKNIKFNDKDFLAERILLNESTKGIIETSKFVNNPLLPKEISDELKNFDSQIGSAVHISDIDEECKSAKELKAVIINSNVNCNFHIFNKENDEKPIYFAYDAFSCIDWNNFKECSLSLERSIRSWLIKHKINNIKLND